MYPFGLRLQIPLNGFCLKKLLLNPWALKMNSPIETLYMVVKFSGQTVEIYLTFVKLNHRNNRTEERKKMAAK